MEDQGLELELISLNKRLSVDQLDELIGPRDHLKFLNFRTALYRKMGMKANPPSRSEALRLMSENPNLIRRPLSVRDDTIVIGFVRDQLEALSGE